MRILVVEDDRSIADALAQGLQRHSYSVDVFYDGASVQELPMSVDYACILLDLGLPKVDGLTLLKAWRSAGVWTPVIILTARDGLSERIQGLDWGADDYVVKPYLIDEILARIRANVRRVTASHKNSSNFICEAGICLDLKTHEVRLRQEGIEQEVDLTSKEFSLLEILLKRAGQIFSREQLEQQLYSFGNEVESNAIEFLIHNLRKKLGQDKIKNIRGVGWKIPKDA